MGRFNIVFDMGEPLYAKDTKIVIEKVVLTKDNETGKVFAQIKMSNLLSKTLIAVKISLTGYDVSGEKIEETEFTYLDLTVAQGEVFGQKTPVDFQNSTVRSFDVKITETVYSDGTKCNDGGSGSCAIPSPEKLSSELSLSEIGQYKSDNTRNAEYIIDEFSDLWRCTCGRLNTESSDCCYSCGASRENLKRTFDKNLLNEERNCKIYDSAIRRYKAGDKYSIEQAISALSKIEDYKDVSALIKKYRAEVSAIKGKERLIEEMEAADERRRKIILWCIIIAVIICAIIVGNVMKIIK